MMPSRLLQNKFKIILLHYCFGQLQHDKFLKTHYSGKHDKFLKTQNSGDFF